MGIFSIIDQYFTPRAPNPDAHYSFAFGVSIHRSHLVKGDFINSSKQYPFRTSGEWIEYWMREVSYKNVNVIHLNMLEESDNINEFINHAKKYGIKLIPEFVVNKYNFRYEQEMDEPAIMDCRYNEVFQNYTTMLQVYKNNPSILAWIITEEVLSNKGMEKKCSSCIYDLDGYLLKIKSLIDEIDVKSDYKQPGLILWGSPEAKVGELPEKKYAKYATLDGIALTQKGRNPAGIVLIDCYPFFKDETKDQLYEDSIKKTVAAIKNVNSDAPLWVLAQAFQSCKWVFPSSNQFYWQTWVAILNGAKGILFWLLTSNDKYSSLIKLDGTVRDEWSLFANLWWEIEPFVNIIVDLEIDSTQTFEIDYSKVTDKTKIGCQIFKRANRSEGYLVVVNQRESDLIPNVSYKADQEKPIEISIKKDGVKYNDPIFDLRLLSKLTSPLEDEMLLPGRGNIYMLGTNSDFQIYKRKYRPVSIFNRLPLLKKRIQSRLRNLFKKSGYPEPNPT